MMEYLFILGRILSNPLTNVMQKKLTNRQVGAFFIVLSAYTLLAMLGGFAVIFIPVAGLGFHFWSSILLASTLDAAGNVFSVKSLQEIELSVFGPLNAYKPVVATVTAALLLQEYPSWVGLAGILIVIAGSVLLHYEPRLSWKETGIKKMFRSRGFWYRLTAIVLYSISVVYLKESIMDSSPVITLVFWSILGWLSLVLLTFLLGLIKKMNFRKNYQLIKIEKEAFFGMAFFFLVTQLFTLLVFEKKFLGYSLAIFQLSALLNIFLGYRIFREKNISFKLIGTLVMVVGVLLIITQ